MATKLEEIMGKLATMVCAPCESKVKEAHGHVMSRVEDVKKLASTVYGDLKKVQEIHADVTSKLRDVSDKPSDSCKDNVASHVEKLSTRASATYNEKIVPVAKKIGDKAAATFHEDVLLKVPDQAIGA